MLRMQKYFWSFVKHLGIFPNIFFIFFSIHPLQPIFANNWGGGSRLRTRFLFYVLPVSIISYKRDKDCFIGRKVVIYEKILIKVPTAHFGLQGGLYRQELNVEWFVFSLSQNFYPPPPPSSRLYNKVSI